MSAVLPDALRPLYETYLAAQDELARQVVAAIEEAWAAAPDLRDEAMAQFVEQVVPVVEGAQAQAAALTDAYLSLAEGIELGTEVPPVGVRADLVTSSAMRGVPAEELWSRPAHEVWTELSKGLPFDRASDNGLNRARKMAETNMQLARTHAARAHNRMRKTVTGYRRVPRGASSCALCLLAATQRYNKADLLPIHPGCDCGIHNLYGHDPGPLLDRAQLDAVHEAVAQFTGNPVDRSASAVDYRRMVVEHEHGELGPVISVRGQNWRQPRDVQAERRRKRERESAARAAARPKGKDATSPAVQALLNL